MNMLFFRSEEALNQWLIAKKAERSQRWYQGRLLLEYHGRTMEQVQDIFKELGLISEFWRI